jgi:hypothetical protein
MDDDWRIENELQDEAEENRREQERWALEEQADAILEAAAEAAERPRRRRLTVKHGVETVKHGVEIVRSSDRCRVSKTFRSDVASNIVDAEWSGAIFEGGRIESKR